MLGLWRNGTPTMLIGFSVLRGSRRSPICSTQAGGIHLSGFGMFEFLINMSGNSMDHRFLLKV